MSTFILKICCVVSTLALFGSCTTNLNLLVPCSADELSFLLIAEDNIEQSTPYLPKEEFKALGIQFSTLTQIITDPQIVDPVQIIYLDEQVIHNLPTEWLQKWYQNGQMLVAINTQPEELDALLDLPSAHTMENLHLDYLSDDQFYASSYVTWSAPNPTETSGRGAFADFYSSPALLHC